MPSGADFHAALQKAFQSASREGVRYLDVQAGSLHRQVGGYPGRNHRIPVCCAAMRAEMLEGDKVLSAPPKGKGDSGDRWLLSKLLVGPHDRRGVSGRDGGTRQSI